MGTEQHAVQRESPTERVDGSGEGPGAAAHAIHDGHTDSGHPDSDHDGHDGHAEMFRRRFWVTLALSVPVVLLSDMVQMWFGYSVDFTGRSALVAGLGTVVFVYGGLPFFQMARGELAERSPGMMSLISMAIRSPSR